MSSLTHPRTPAEPGSWGRLHHAPTERVTVSAYIVLNYTITNTKGYEDYPPAAMPSIAASGAEVLVADNHSEAIEGKPGDATVVLRFDSKEAARAWYESADYHMPKAIRIANADGVAVICDGFVTPGRS
jgi:uncharacterized protein (DUF1330 family)